MAEAGLWLRPQLALPGDGHEQRGLVQLLLSELGRDCTLGAAGDAVVLRLPATTPGGAALVAEVTQGPGGTQVCEFGGSERAQASLFVTLAKGGLGEALEPQFGGAALQAAKDTGLSQNQMTQIRTRLRGGVPLDDATESMMKSFESRLKLLMCRHRVAETEPVGGGEASPTHQRMKGLAQEYEAKEEARLQAAREAQARKDEEKFRRRAKAQAELEAQRREDADRLQAAEDRQRRETEELQRRDAEERQRQEAADRERRRKAEAREPRRHEERRRSRSRARRDRDRDRSRRRGEPSPRRRSRDRERTRREGERSPHRRSRERERRSPEVRREEVRGGARPAAADAAPRAKERAAPRVVVKEERRWSGEAGGDLGEMAHADWNPRDGVLTVRDKPRHVQAAAARAEAAGVPAAAEGAPALPPKFGELVALCSERNRARLTKAIGEEWPENQAPGVLEQGEDARGQPRAFCAMCGRKQIDSDHLGEISHLRKLVRLHGSFLTQGQLGRRGLRTASGRLAIAEEEYRLDCAAKERGERPRE